MSQRSAVADFAPADRASSRRSAARHEQAEPVVRRSAAPIARSLIELLVAVAGSTIIVLMVAAGGSLMAGVGEHAQPLSDESLADAPEPPSFCRELGGRLICAGEPDS